MTDKCKLMPSFSDIFSAQDAQSNTLSDEGTDEAPNRQPSTLHDEGTDETANGHPNTPSDEGTDETANTEPHTLPDEGTQVAENAQLQPNPLSDRGSDEIANAQPNALADEGEDETANTQANTLSDEGTDEAVTQPDEGADETANTQTNSFVERQHVREQEVCRFFAKAGWCKFDIRCKHQHGEGAWSSTQPDEGAGETVWSCQAEPEIVKKVAPVKEEPAKATEAEDEEWKDNTYKCVDCSEDWVDTADDQEFMGDKGFAETPRTLQGLPLG